MNHVLVIADDLSGAAEIAGIAHRFGLPTRLIRSPTTDIHPGVTVVDTDSRHLPPEHAARATRLLMHDLREHAFDLIYKKTDSVLRGNVHSEAQAVALARNLHATLLLPQNPSRGRVIAGGRYRINGVLLQETEFANDPDHPVRTSDPRELLGGACECRDITDPRPLDGTIIASAESQKLVDQWAARVDQRTLPAGSSDFFEAVLRARGLSPSREPVAMPLFGKNLLVRGTTANAAQFSRLWRERKLYICPDPSPDEVLRALRLETLVAATAPLTIEPGAARRIESDLAEMVQWVLAQTTLDALLLEGGSTASAVCRRMKWDDFTVVGEYATGVVAMRCKAQRLIIKPGSYPWPESLWT